jgi:chloramphenicol-sensitive protein RarD
VYNLYNDLNYSGEGHIMDRSEYTKGLILGVLSFTLWGLLPLYWKLVDAISPYQIFAHRVVWSFLFVVIFIILK